MKVCDNFFFAKIAKTLPNLHKQNNRIIVYTEYRQNYTFFMIHTNVFSEKDSSVTADCITGHKNVNFRL